MSQIDDKQQCRCEIFLWVYNAPCLLQISHAAVSALCRSIKLQCELYSSRQIAICLDPYCGLGFVLWCLARYSKPTPTRHTCCVSPPVWSLLCCVLVHSSTFLSFVSRLLAFTQVTSPSWFLPWSWRAACPCGWARSVSTVSETPSALTLSWSSALKDWELRLSYSR